MDFLKPKVYLPCDGPEALEAQRDAMEALGYKVTAHRQGFKATKLYYGKWWLHLILLPLTHGFGNLIYLAICVLGRKSQCVYLRVGPPKKKVKKEESEGGMPAWVDKAFAKHLRRGTPGYEPQPLYPDQHSQE